MFFLEVLYLRLFINLNHKKKKKKKEKTILLLQDILKNA